MLSRLVRTTVYAMCLSLLLWSTLQIILRLEVGKKGWWYITGAWLLKKCRKVFSPSRPRSYASILLMLFSRDRAFSFDETHLTIRFDLLLKTLAGTSLAWLCLVRFKR